MAQNTMQATALSRVAAAGKEIGIVRNARRWCLRARRRASNAVTKSETIGPVPRVNRWSSLVNLNASSAGHLERMKAEAEVRAEGAEEAAVGAEEEVAGAITVAVAGEMRA